MASRQPTPRKVTAGFTLLEVVVAFVILALALGVSFETFSTGLRGTLAAGDHAGAIVRAQSRLSEIGLTEPVQPGVLEGRFDGTYGWRQEVRIADRHESTIGGRDAHVLYDVALTVYWGTGAQARSLVLNTSRVVSGSPP